MFTIYMKQKITTFNPLIKFDCHLSIASQRRRKIGCINSIRDETASDKEYVPAQFTKTHCKL